MNKIFLLIAIPLLLASCHSRISQEEDLDMILRQRIADISPSGTTDYFILPESNDFANIPQDPKNPLNAAKVELGKNLFYETALALNPLKPESKGTYSCASCHDPALGFLPGTAQAFGDGGIGYGENGKGRRKNTAYNNNQVDAQHNRPLSVLNTAYMINTQWDGRFGANGANESTAHLWTEENMTTENALGYAGMETQNIEGLILHRMVINKDVTDSLGYTALFDLAFADDDIAEEDKYSLLTGSLAISAYLRTLTTSEAPFQKWLKGNDYTMSASEKNGALVFFDKGLCFSCHTSPSFSANKFYSVGVKSLYQSGSIINGDPNDGRNFGRGGYTGLAEDMYKFKVPQLYNLRDAPFLFHGSSKESLLQVVLYFNKGVKENSNIPESQLGASFKPLNLTTNEVKDLVNFLEDALYDPTWDRMVPDVTFSGQCFPNNDVLSQLEMGCQ